jgi:hypothetical protein
VSDRPTGNERVTREVGDEGGSDGEVEVAVDSGPGEGSEAGETWRPATGRTAEVRRDETGEGKRSPSD